MRISDWSSDVCSSDLHYDTMTKRLAQGLAGDVAAVIALMERNPELQARREIFQMARSAMQLQLTFTEGMALPHLVPTRVRSILETRREDALREDRKSVLYGKRVLVRVDISGWRILQKKNNQN